MSARRCEPGCRKNAVFGSTEKPLSNSAAFVVHARIEKCFFPLLPAEPLDRVARRHLVELDPELDEGPLAGEVGAGKIAVLEARDVVAHADPEVLAQVEARGKAGAVIHLADAPGVQGADPDAHVPPRRPPSTLPQ